MRYVARTLLALSLISPGHVSTAQTYPVKPVRILVGFAPGGGTDIMARAVGAKMTESMKQQFIIENRPGANANVAAKLAAESPADGYTVLFMSVAHIMSKPVYRNLGYDIERDLASITVVSEVSNVFAAHPTLPANSVKALLVLARARPGELTYATSGVASPEHFAGEMFKMMTKSSLLAVPGAIPIVRAKKVRPLAVLSEQRVAALPDVPNMKESGVDDFVVPIWYGLLAPAGTPREIVARLNVEVHKALASADLKKLLANSGVEPLVNTPEQFAAFIKSETVRYAQVVKDAGLKAQ